MQAIHWNNTNEHELYWKGYTHHERHAAIDQIELIIDSLGFIVDFHMFSDMEIAFRIEINGGKINELYRRLSAYMLMDKEELPVFDAVKEYVLNLHTTFTDATGDLMIEVPAVPG